MSAEILVPSEGERRGGGRKEKGKGMGKRGLKRRKEKVIGTNLHHKHPPLSSTRHTNGKSHSGYCLFAVHSLSHDFSSHPDILNSGK